MGGKIRPQGGSDTGQWIEENIHHPPKQTDNIEQRSRLGEAWHIDNG